MGISIMPCDTYYVVLRLNPMVSQRRVRIHLSKVLLEEGDVFCNGLELFRVIGGPFPADGGAHMADDWIGKHCA